MIRKKGFTLIELLIVIIIVGILAAVSVPMMTSNVNRAKATEATAALGSIRTQLRILKAETGEYDKYRNGAALTTGDVVSKNIGFSASDLEGKYFSNTAYCITAIGDNTFDVSAYGSTAKSSSGITVSIDETGEITGP